MSTQNSKPNYSEKSKNRYFDQTVFPKSEFLEFTAKYTSHIGMFPSQLLFKDRLTFQSIYENYSKVVIAYYVYIAVAMFAALIGLLQEQPLRMGEIFKNVATTLLCSVSLGRMLALRLNPAFVKNVKFMIEFEKIIQSTEDDQVYRGYICRISA